MASSFIFEGKLYKVSCSCCGGRAVIYKEPTRDDFKDGEFQCRGEVDCQYNGPGEDFHFTEIKI